jgi:hypothetical protein
MCVNGHKDCNNDLVAPCCLVNKDNVCISVRKGILNVSARCGVNAKIVQDVRDGRSCDADDHDAHFRDLCYHGLSRHV